MSLATKTNSTGYVSRMGILHWVLLIPTLLSVSDAFAAKPYPNFADPNINKLFNPILPHKINIRIIRPVITGWNHAQFRDNWIAHFKRYGGTASRTWGFDCEWDRAEQDDGRFKTNVDIKSNLLLVLPTFKYPANLPRRWRRMYDDYLADDLKCEMNHIKNFYYFHNRSEMLINRIINVPVWRSEMDLQDRRIKWVLNQVKKETSKLSEDLMKKDRAIQFDLFREVIVPR